MKNSKKKSEKCGVGTWKTKKSIELEQSKKI